jgi:ATP-dependent Zn protease
VRRISDELYSRAKGILTNHRPELERIAQELIQKETLDSRQLKACLIIPNDRSPHSIGKYKKR